MSFIKTPTKAAFGWVSTIGMSFTSNGFASKGCEQR
jgi:hypothetical protein